MVRNLIYMLGIVAVAGVLLFGFVNDFSIRTVLFRAFVAFMFFVFWGVVATIVVAAIKSDVETRIAPEKTAREQRESSKVISYNRQIDKNKTKQTNKEAA